MRRRGFLKAMVAAAAGLLAVTPRVIRSVSAGTLTPAWTKEEQADWNVEGFNSYMEWRTSPEGQKAFLEMTEAVHSAILRTPPGSFISMKS